MAKKTEKRASSTSADGATATLKKTSRAKATGPKAGSKAGAKSGSKAGASGTSTTNKASSSLELKPKTTKASKAKVLTPASITSYPTAVKYLLNRPDFERMRVIRDLESFKLDRMRTLLAALGDPHEQVRTIHIAGTVGKGSTSAMVGAMLHECGYAVGSYTSPHLTDLRERVCIDGEMISHATFVALMKKIAEVVEGLEFEPTFFEIMTALAFMHFADEAVDIAIIEAGLGGRLDCTNVIKPEAIAITKIALDHERILGHTLADIAREKAGIFKKDVPCLTFEQDPEVDAVFQSAADECGAPLQIVNRDIEFSNRFCSTNELGPHTRVCLYTDLSRLEHLPVPLAGEHQAPNCGLALALMDLLKRAGFKCPDDRLTSGLAKTRMIGRMQLAWKSPRILVDGAHNPESIGALMRCVGAHLPYDSMVCIFGCCQDKNVDEMLNRVNLGADKIIFTRAQGNPRAADPVDLQRAFTERSGKMSQIADSIPEAIELASRAVSREDLICVTGSFYLVGETLKHLDKIR